MFRHWRRRRLKRELWRVRIIINQNKEGIMNRIFSLCALSLLAIVCLAPGEAKDLKPGLLGEYYDMGDAVEDFPNIPAERKPTIKLIDKQLNVESTSEEVGN